MDEVKKVSPSSAAPNLSEGMVMPPAINRKGNEIKA
jgi:hypothetical protein